MPNWQVREVTMFHTYAFFALGFISGVIVILSWAQRIADEKNKELRQWRKEALAAQADALYWQKQYSKDVR
jgi:hypothetical protein